MMGCDAMGSLDVVSRGNKHILSSVDYLPRWPMVMLIPDVTERNTVKFYYQAIIAQFGVSNYRGSNFVLHYTKDVLSQLGCRSVSIIAFRPQINRLNQTL